MQSPESVSSEASRTPGLFANVSAALIASVIARFSGLVLYVLVTRSISQQEAGVYALAMNYVGLLLPISCLGLGDAITRDVARHPESATRYVSNLTLLRVFSGLVCCGLLAIGATGIFHYSLTTTWFVMLMALSIIPDGLNQIFQSLFAALGQQVRYAVTVVVVAVFNLTLAWWLLNIQAGLMWLAGARVISVSIGLLVSLALAGVAVPLLSRETWKALDLRWLTGRLQEFLPFTLMVVLYTIEWRADIVILSAFRPESEIAHYYAAETILISLLLMLEAYRLAVLPRMSVLVRKDPDRLARLHDRSFWYLSAIALPMAVGISLLGNSLLKLLKPEFAAASGILVILMYVLTISYLNEPNGLLMIAAGQQRRTSQVFGISVAVNIVANLVLAPVLGGMGAALARALSVTTFSVINGVLVTRHVRAHHPFRYAPRLALAAGGMAASLWFLQQIMAWWLAGLISSAVYVLLLLAFKGLPIEDLKTLRDVTLARIRGTATRPDSTLPQWRTK